MTTLKVLTLLVAAAALLTPGCGGGGSGAATGGAQSLSFGPLATRVVGTAQPPVTSGGSGTVVTGVAGATFSSIVLNNPKLTPANSESLINKSTRLAFDFQGFLYSMKPDGSDQVRLTSDQPSWVNWTQPSWSPDGSMIAFIPFVATGKLPI